MRILITFRQMIGWRDLKYIRDGKRKGRKMNRDVTERLDNGLSKSKAVKTYAEILKSPMDALFAKGLLHPIKTFLNGTWLEHPLHPVLTDIPIGAWTLAIAFDLL